MVGSKVIDYESLNLDQSHEFQLWKDSRFNRSEKPLKFLSLYFNYPLVYRIRKLAAYLLCKIGNSLVHISGRIFPGRDPKSGFFC
jgi:hypothetical protein